MVVELVTLLRTATREAHSRSGYTLSLFVGPRASRPHFLAYEYLG